MARLQNESDLTPKKVFTKGKRLQWVEIILPVIAAILAVLVVYNSGRFISQQIGGRTESVDLSPSLEKALLRDLSPTNQNAASQHEAFTWWRTTTGLHILICLIAIFIGIYIAYQALDNLSQYKKFGWIILLLVLAFVAAIIGGTDSEHASYMKNVKLILDSTLGKGFYLPRASAATVVIDRLSIFTYFLLLCISSTILWIPSKSAQSPSIYLETRLRLLRLLLYTATFPFITSILQLQALLRSTLTYLNKDEYQHIFSGIEGIGGTHVAIMGIYYSVILAALYLPSIMILNKRASVLAKRFSDSIYLTKQDEWLKERGLLSSPSEDLLRIVAILGPLLAGPTGELIRRFI